MVDLLSENQQFVITAIYQWQIVIWVHVTLLEGNSLYNPEGGLKHHPRVSTMVCNLYQEAEWSFSFPTPKQSSEISGGQGSNRKLRLQTDKQAHSERADVRLTACEDDWEENWKKSRPFHKYTVFLHQMSKAIAAPAESTLSDYFKLQFLFFKRHKLIHTAIMWRCSG